VLVSTEKIREIWDALSLLLRWTGGEAIEEESFFAAAMDASPPLESFFRDYRKIAGVSTVSCFWFLYSQLRASIPAQAMMLDQEQI
jgi:hypothetical protein